jgi:hypothetical protein
MPPAGDWLTGRLGSSGVGLEALTPTLVFIDRNVQTNTREYYAGNVRMPHCH